LLRLSPFLPFETTNAVLAMCGVRPVPFLIGTLIGGSALKTIGMIALLRLSPFLPFETTNAVLAMCGVRPVPFLIGTLIGVTPRTVFIVLAAGEAHRLDLHSVGGRWLLVGGIVVTLLCVALIAWIARHALERATRGGRVPPAPAPAAG
jgi:uncharacterized membrane protein YdjX (TVP38/TMEM64 family)